MKNDQKGDVYLTYAEFAERHGVKETTVRQWVHRGLVMVRQFGLKPHIWENEPVLKLPRGRPRLEK